MDKFKDILFTILGWLSIYFFPVVPFIVAIGFFVLADTITGIMAALKRKETFNSIRLRCIIPKFTSYSIAILVANVIEKEFFPDFPVLKLISGLVAYIELKSLDENMKVITGHSFFKAITSKLKGR